MKSSMEKQSFFHRHRLPILIGGLSLSLATLGVTTFAWFSTSKMNNMLISSGDLTVQNATFTYYRWNFPKTNEGYILPSTIKDGDGSLVTGSLSYSSSGSTTSSGTADSADMNTFDPYFASLYKGDDGNSIDQRTALFVKLEVTVETACNFDLTFKSTIDADYTFPTGTKQDLLSKYITFKTFPGNAFDPASSSYTSDAERYAALKGLFFANYQGTKYSFVDSENAPLSIISETSVMNGDVSGQVSKSLTYWLCLDYDADKVSSAYGGYELYAGVYTLYQNFYYTIIGTQNGI